MIRNLLLQAVTDRILFACPATDNVLASAFSVWTDREIFEFYCEEIGLLECAYLFFEEIHGLFCTHSDDHCKHRFTAYCVELGFGRYSEQLYDGYKLIRTMRGALVPETVAA